MKINYNVTGNRRKFLVGVISQELSAHVKYNGMPTASYEVGGYTITKTGELVGPDDRNLVTALRETYGFEAIGEEYDDFPDIDQHHPGQYADPDVPPTEEMLKLAEAWMEGIPESGDPECVQSPDHLIIEVPLQGFTPEKLDNLTKMVNAKAPLLKAALRADDLPIRVGEETVKFPWFRGDTDGDHAQAYAALVSLLCKTAMQKKRVTAKEKDVPSNPKYAFRCFLLSIGMIGDEYKAARKLLLSGLVGSSAWKDHKQKGAADDE